MKNVFNDFYQGYDDWYQTTVGQFVAEQEAQTLNALLQPQAEQKILEIGCGTGHFTLEMVQKGCRITGIDQAPKMLQQAQTKLSAYSKQVQLQIMDAQKLEYADNQFDSVFSMATLEFITDPQVAYHQMYRVVKPGGTIVLGTIQKGSAWADFYESPACRGTAYEYAHFLTLKQIQNWDPQHFASAQQCLFLPPNLPESEYNSTNEKNAQKTNPIGGFVCLQFRKSAAN